MEFIKTYKRICIIVTLLIFSGIISAQQLTVALTDGQFIYRLVIEKLPNPHYRHYINESAPVQGKKQIGFTVGTVKSITIINVKDTTQKQIIIPAKNETAWPWTDDNKGEKFIIEDMNFDGENDVRLLNSADDFTYYCWVYHPTNGQFVQDTALDKLVGPQFDQNEHLIYENWQGYINKGTETFKYIDGKLTLIEEEETKDDGTTTTISIKKLVDGKLVLTNKVDTPDKN